VESAKILDLVVPVYNEEQNLLDFYDEVGRVFDKDLPNLRWRAIFVDDGSRDRSWRLLMDLARTRDNVRAIKLNRNYGAHVAISAGLFCADGDAIVVLAADGQDPPTVIPEFVRRWTDGAKVVWGVRAARHEAAHRKLFSLIFHQLVRRYALPGYPSQGTGSFCLIDRVVARNLRRMRENFRTIFGLISIQGYPAAEVPYVREERAHGRSGWSAHKMIRTAIDVFTSYSHFPIRVITWVGFGSCLLAVLGILYQLTHYLTATETLRGWTMLFLAVCFFGGIQTLALGMLGEYVWRTFHEVKRRPLWYVEDATFEVERAGP
jgi:polyisoprenyl-phosphate glycosyltransferase